MLLRTLSRSGSPLPPGRPLHVVALAAAFAGGAAGCVEPFGGAHIEFALSGAHIPGEPREFGRPPAGTHYEFYAYENAVVDGRDAVLTYKVAEFDIRPVVDTGSPCFIFDEKGPFPGLHRTMLLAKYEEQFGIDADTFDPANPPANMSEGDVIDFLTGQVRVNNFGRLQAAVKAIASHSPAQYPPVDPSDPCVGDAGYDGGIPPARCIDDASNQARAELCEQFWSEHPQYFEGADLPFTLPLNGTWYGAVDGTDPRSNAFLGGAGFNVEPDLAHIDGLLLNWQYNCDPDEFNADARAQADALGRGLEPEDIIAHHCAPQFPDSVPESQRSAVGYHYMSGVAVDKVRGAINVPLANRVFAQLAGEAAIFADLDRDNVQF